MAKNDIRLIIQGGALCAAFSFMAFFVPILGSIFSYFALLPVFYVGICLGLRAYLFAVIIPLVSYFVLLGSAGIGIFSITIFAPSITILYWHFFKEKNTYKYSSMDILHRLSSRFLGLITIGFCYLKLTNSSIFETLTNKIEAINNLTKIPATPGLLIETLPGIISFLGLLMVWLNFQMAYTLALKANKSIRKPTEKQNIFLPPIWDIALIAALWLIIANHLFIDSALLGIFSRTALCICAFPLLIDGLEIAQLIAKAYKLPPALTVIFIILIFLLVWPMIFVVVLGLIEPLCGFKKKYYQNSN